MPNINIQISEAHALMLSALTNDGKFSESDFAKNAIYAEIDDKIPFMNVNSIPAMQQVRDEVGDWLTNLMLPIKSNRQDFCITK